MNKANEDKHGRFIILDGMRGIAALAVMVFHYTSHSNYQAFCNAPVAVDLFFILSGFVLSFSYGDRVLKRQIGFLDFISRRIIRLHPMFVVGLVWGSVNLYYFGKFGYTTYSKHEIIASLFYNGLFLPFLNSGSTNLFERSFASVGAIFPANSASWSLFCEMFANLFFFRLVFMQRKTLRGIVLASLCLLLGFSLVTNFSQYSYNLSVDTGWSTTNFLPGLARVFFGFAFGIFIQKSQLKIAIEDVTQSSLWTSTFRFFAKRPMFLYALLIGILLIPFHAYGLVSFISVALLCPILVFVGAFTSTENQIINRMARFLGWTSYPIYCLHIPIGNFLTLINNEGGMYKVLPLPFAISASLMTVIVSIVLTRFYEAPARDYFTTISRTWRQKSISTYLP